MAFPAGAGLRLTVPWTPECAAPVGSFATLFYWAAQVYPRDWGSPVHSSVVVIKIPFLKFKF